MYESQVKLETFLLFLLRFPFYSYSVMLLWNKRYQEVALVVSSVTTKVKGVAQTRLPEIGDVVWDVADYSGSSQVRAASLRRVSHHRGEPHQHDQHLLSSFLEQELLLRGDQCHCDKKSEAGKVSRGALVFPIFRVDLQDFLISQLSVPGSIQRQVVSI